MIEASPEKAGVGGSTPSLATINSATSKHPATQSCPTLSQKLNSVCGVASNLHRSNRDETPTSERSEKPTARKIRRGYANLNTTEVSEAVGIGF